MQCGAIRTPALTEKFAGLEITAFAQGFEVFRADFAGESEQPSSVTLPLTDNTFTLGIIIAMLQMIRCITYPVRHGAYREHKDHFR